MRTSHSGRRKLASCERSSFSSPPEANKLHQSIKMHSRRRLADAASSLPPLLPSPSSMLLLLLLLPSLIVALAECQQVTDVQPTGRPGPMWLHASGSSPTPMSAKLHELLIERLGPNIRASSDYRDFTDVKLDESVEAWRLLHERAAAFARDQVHLYEPQLGHLLTGANVSQDCRTATRGFFRAASHLDAWAIQMWSASASWPPTGLFDGHFTDLGSYRGCIDIEQPRVDGSRDEMPAASFIASYCLLGFRPVVPSRARFHQIYEEESVNLTGLFERTDILHRAAHFAQYFHYFYIKMAACVPVQCGARDLQQVAKLVGQRLGLMAAPVKCITRAHPQAPSNLSNENAIQSAPGDDETQPLMIELNGQMNLKQYIALALIGGFFSLVLLVSLWHGVDVMHQVLFTSKHSLSGENEDDQSEKEAGYSNGTQDHKQQQVRMAHPRGFKGTTFHYFSMITNGREFIDTRLRANEILCLHGFRVVTMFWIVCVHTLQYNEWSGFSRTFENVDSLQNPFVQPLINANYVVDNFFLMSGLLAAYTIWNGNNRNARDFSPLRCLLGRYLRLTPQVLLISLAYMLLPLVGHGPFWYDMTHHAGAYCEKNWWLNLLHVQSFYNKHEMCNLVGWWISVDMFYYVIGLALLWLLLARRVQLAASCTALFLIYCMAITAWQHYTGGFTPNNLGTVPQIGEVWSEFVVHFFWSPYPHAFVFFLGLWLGYALANRLAYRFVRRWAKPGWFLSIGSLLAINYSSRLWITGTLDLKEGPQLASTAYNIVCVVLWACSFGWMIMACHYDCAPALNRLLSTEVSVMLSKASFIIYLSHMLILRAFYGSQYNLLEVSIATILIILVGMCFLSVLFGIFICVAFEGPCLKFQRLVLDTLKQRSQRQMPVAGASYLSGNQQAGWINTKQHQHPSIDSAEKQSLNLGPTSVTLLK